MNSSAPNSHSKTIGREEEALRDLTSTQFSGISRGALLGLGMVLMLSGLGADFMGSVLLGGHPLERTFQALDRLLPSAQRCRSVKSPAEVWRLLPEPSQTREAERILEEHSALGRALRPPVQSLLTRAFRAGNEQVWVAPGGWLFFRKDWDSVAGAAFLPAERSRGRKAAWPVRAIVDFRRQLLERGIELVVLPVPVKPVLEGHRLTGDPSAAVLCNSSIKRWMDLLREESVMVLDPTEVLREWSQRKGVSAYLRADTHWCPEAMEAVARWTAGVLRGRFPELAGEEGVMVREPAQAVESDGDTLALLGLPAGQRLFERERVMVHPVTRGGSVWKADLTSPVLLLGDSFTNIFSMGGLGWGEGAGLGEQLSVELGRTVDVLSRNSDGALATRQMLQRELAAGRDRLAGKKVVVWEFATRELSFGDWRTVELRLGTVKRAAFFCPPAGQRRLIRGTVAEMGPVPRPGTVPYREHIVALRLVDVELEGEGGQKGERVGECLVYAWSMREQVLGEVGRLRIGERVSFEVRDWEGVAPELEKFQRGELSDAALAAEPVTWGELRVEAAETGAPSLR